MSRRKGIELRHEFLARRAREFEADFAFGSGFARVATEGGSGNHEHLAVRLFELHGGIFQLAEFNLVQVGSIGNGAGHLRRHDFDLIAVHTAIDTHNGRALFAANIDSRVALEVELDAVHIELVGSTHVFNLIGALYETR